MHLARLHDPAPVAQRHRRGGALAAVLGLMLLAGCGGTSAAEIEACVERGREYFTAIGAFPTLSTGRDALAEARERCNRTLTAF